MALDVPVCPSSQAYLPSVVQLQNGILLMIESQPLKLMKMQSVANDCKLVGASVAHSCATMRFHAGTAAFGSLILTVVKLAKWWFAYLAMEIKKANPNNRVIKCLACCIMKCVDCFESCLRYLSKNAYLYSTIKGTNFCVSSYKSFIMLWNNFGRFGATGISSEIVMMLFGKLSIMMFATLAAYYSVEYTAEFQDITSENYISSMGQFVITIVVLFMSYIVAEIFFDVYDIATDSIMLCYCFDAEDGNGQAFKTRMGDDLKFEKTKEEDEHKRWIVQLDT